MMRYRKLKAQQVFNGKAFLDDKILVITEDGTIEDLLPAGEADGDMETYDGILMPGMINCHCHLELSHLKGIIPPGTGLVNFLLTVVKSRGQYEATKLPQIEAAENELYNNGVVAVADICNTPDAIDVKKKSRLYWHSLVEIINLHDNNTTQQISKCQGVLQQHGQQNLAAVLTPHAPYSISNSTFAAINEATAGKIISVHNQESAAENELFIKGSGDFLKMYRQLNFQQSPFPVTGKSSLQTWLPYFTNGQTILLVHNTFIGEEDIIFAQQHAETYGLKLVYCLCPNANQYIENHLPPVDVLLKHNCHIVLGTDSYSSNWQLSIAAEVQTLLKHFPKVQMETALQWATSNGAAALGLYHLGSFERGKKPGVVLMQDGFTTKRIV